MCASHFPPSRYSIRKYSFGICVFILNALLDFHIGSRT
ncbi:MAG: YSIRK-type signal peptide-containing protein [Bacteroidales bacterium]|nr:YSIRK-type signal peptide-containing protein [Bacteroidales bacterium]